jgi:peptidoglycan/xylan/chitin deacetylase (PgdA/CDA1 family)
MLKKLLYFFLSVLAFGLIGLFLAKPTRAAGNSLRVPILIYHYIGGNPNPADTARYALSVTPDKFNAQMKYLAENGYTPITLNILYAIYNGTAQAPAKPIVLTFDDGYVDFYYNAFPILQSYGFHAVAFLPTGLIDNYPGFHMTWDQVRQINSSGLIDFESHSVSHPNLNSLGSTRLTQELVDSKATLESEIGHPVNFIAYPYGASSSRVQTAARNAGYLGGLGTWSGQASGFSMNMPRIRISGSTSLSSFASRV